MSQNLWAECLEYLKDEFPSQQFNTWLRPLQAEASENEICLYAPNKFVLDWVSEKYLNRIKELLKDLVDGQAPGLTLKIGSASTSSSNETAESSLKPTRQSRTDADSRKKSSQAAAQASRSSSKNDNADNKERSVEVEGAIKHQSFLNSTFTFDTFVEGKSNQLARAASVQVAENPGSAYNPLFLYGGVGLGKTHLMHAVGNEIIKKNPNAKVVYLHSERFVADMVKALQLNAAGSKL